MISRPSSRSAKAVARLIGSDGIATVAETGDDRSIKFSDTPESVVPNYIEWRARCD